MTQTVIKRPEWGRGVTSKKVLFDPVSGLKCCLGCECEFRGVSLSQMRDCEMPCTLQAKYAGSRLFDLGNLTTVLGADSEFSGVAANINDETELGILQTIAESRAALSGFILDPDMGIEPLREAMLIHLFAKYGVELTFID